MKIKTKVKDCIKTLKFHHVLPDTYITIVIDEFETEVKKSSKDNIILPPITPAKQKELLNLIPNGYQQEASNELVGIIGESHLNTNTTDLIES